MTTKWFNNLSVLSIHKELTDSINLVDVGNEFASKYDGRRMNLGKFVYSDLLWLFKILCPLFFIKFLFSIKWKPLKNYEKCFLFHLKSSFRSRDIQFFVFPSSPLFLSVSHCVRGCLKISLKVYDVINCLNKNLITHCVWYLGKEKRYDTETLSIDTVLIKNIFMAKS